MRGTPVVPALHELSLDRRREPIAAIRQTVREEAATIAQMAVTETALGRAEDKVQKNLLVGEKTPGVEILEPWAVTGDHGITLQELAPWGVIAAIAPSTNPTETIICNGIGMLAAGNAVVFCPHPLAAKVSGYMIAALNRAVARAGGPESVFAALADPSVELAQQLMRHPGIALVVVTGGPGVVREAMKSGKRVIGAGPGNPPSVVDETADVERAGRDLVRGASLDNNIICTDEKEVFVVSAVADRLKSAMEANGAVEIHGPQIDRLVQLVLEPGERKDPRAAFVRKDWVGKDASRFLDALGVKAEARTRLIIAEVERDHPFVWTELLMPILPIVRVKTAEEAMDLAVAAEKGNRHTASMHSHHVDRLSRMARRINCSIFIKNGPNFAGLGMGGEGYTSFTIAGPTGEGMTNARHFTRVRRCTLVDAFRIV
ncbi:MAG: aldehyde dehydrogenase family protein [Candidatus Eisenbacteria bacterium]